MSVCGQQNHAKEIYIITRLSFDGHSVKNAAVAPYLSVVFHDVFRPLVIPVHMFWFVQDIVQKARKGLDRVQSCHDLRLQSARPLIFAELVWAAQLALQAEVALAYLSPSRACENAQKKA